MHPLATSTPAGGGWFYDLLRKSGVSASTAHTVVEFVFRPLEIILVILIAILVAHFGARAIRRLLGRVGREAAARSDSERAGARMRTVVALVANLWRAFVAVVAVLVILGIFGVNLTPLLASATVIGATIGFGAQSLVRDYLSGVLLTLEDQFGIGDTITVNEATGTVEELTLRVTRLRAADGAVWYVPNGDIRKLANTSRGWAKAVVDLPFSPTHRDALEEAKRVVEEAGHRVAADPHFAGAAHPPAEVLGVVSADATTCTLRVTLRTRPSTRDAVERALRQAVLEDLIGAGLWVQPAGGTT